MASPVMVVPTDALVVWRSAPLLAVTSTVVVVAPTSSVVLMVNVEPTTASCPVTLDCVKPVLLKVTL